MTPNLSTLFMLLGLGLVYWFPIRRWYRHWGATNAEIERTMLGDAEVPRATYETTLAVMVDAPAAATEMDLQQSVIVRGIFKAREWIMRSHPAREQETRAFLAQMRGIGWGVLAEIPGREIVMGAVTQPWMADVVFRPLPPDEFAVFHEPDYVKIVWTLRADSLGAAKSIFRTETRVVTTDPTARAKFRRYWSFASPGIIVIRWMSLGPLKADAERRARAPGSRKAELKSRT